MSETHLFEMSNVVIAYGAGQSAVTVVDGASLHVDTGEIVALVGESGSGKSTIARAALRLLEPRSGRILLNGEDLTHRSQRQLKPARRTMHMVLQDSRASMNPRQTIGEILTHPLRSHGVGTGASRAQAAREALERVELPAEFVSRYAAELSGGQRQRVGIARALILRPGFVVADEPVSALDTSVRAGVLDLFRERQREDGFGCLFITHDMSVARAIADRIIIMRHGEIVETGPTERVFEAPRAEYTRTLIGAAPVPDPVLQRARRAERLARAAEVG